MSSFMSGLVSGFMDTFGAGGGFGAAAGDAGAAGAAGGVAGSAGADTGAASIAADSSTAGSDMAAQGATQAPAKSGGGGMLGGLGGGGGGGSPLGGIMGGGGSSAPSTPTPSGGGAAGSVSTNTNVAGTSAANAGGASMSSPGMQPDSSGIIRQNPYGNAPKQGPSTQDYMKAALKGAQQGSQLGQGNQVRNDMNVNVGNSYTALFGSATQAGNYGGGQVGVQQAPMPAATPPPNLTPPPSTAMAPPPPPAPMPQAPQQPPPMALGQTISDQRAKQNIKYANRDMDKLLQSVYTNLITKRGK